MSICSYFQHLVVQEKRGLLKNLVRIFNVLFCRKEGILISYGSACQLRSYIECGTLYRKKGCFFKNDSAWQFSSFVERTVVYGERWHFLSKLLTMSTLFVCSTYWSAGTGGFYKTQQPNFLHTANILFCRVEPGGQSLKLLNMPTWLICSTYCFEGERRGFKTKITPARDTKQCGGVGSRCVRYKQQ